MPRAKAKPQEAGEPGRTRQAQGAGLKEACAKVWLQVSPVKKP